MLLQGNKWTEYHRQRSPVFRCANGTGISHAGKANSYIDQYLISKNLLFTYQVLSSSCRK